MLPNAWRAPGRQPKLLLVWEEDVIKVASGTKYGVTVLSKEPTAIAPTPFAAPLAVKSPYLPSFSAAKVQGTPA